MGEERKALILLVIFDLLLSAFTFLVFAQSSLGDKNPYPWQSYRHDSQNTGFSEGPAPNTNRTYWTVSVDGGGYGFGQPYNVGPVVSYNQVFINGHKEGLRVWNQTDGTLLWENSLFVYRGGPAVAYGLVYIGSNGVLVAFNITTGNTVWEYNIYGYSQPLFSPQVADGRVFFNNRDGWLFCVDALTGDFLWKHETGLNEEAYVAAADGRVFTQSSCLNETDGTLIWEFSEGGGTGAPVVVNRCVFFNRGSISCLDVSNGSMIWKYETDGVGGLAVAYSRVFACADGLICLNITNGDFLWSNGPASGYPFGSPAVADGKVFVTAHNYLNCFDAYNGSLIWSYFTPDDSWLGRLTSPVVADGMIFVAANNYIYAFGEGRTTDFPLWIIVPLFLTACFVIIVLKKKLSSQVNK